MPALKFHCKIKYYMRHRQKECCSSLIWLQWWLLNKPTLDVLVTTRWLPDRHNMSKCLLWLLQHVQCKCFAYPIIHMTQAKCNPRSNEVPVRYDWYYHLLDYDHLCSPVWPWPFMLLNCLTVIIYAYLSGRDHFLLTCLDPIIYAHLSGHDYSC